MAAPPLFWPVNCLKIGGHVALPSGPTGYTLYCSIMKRKINVIYFNAKRFLNKVGKHAFLYLVMNF